MILAYKNKKYQEVLYYMLYNVITQKGELLWIG